MTNYDIVKKLVGEIEPVGETNTDEKRFKNLEQMTNLVDSLLLEIRTVSECKTSHEYSVKKAGEFADNFLYIVGIKQ